jgi:saccharopine dehydrogenase-like NADP-dependent oxidoreductase
MSLAENKTSNHPNATPIALDILIMKDRCDSKADIVISMLPAHLHIEVARDCVVYKSLVTASYVSEAMQLDAAVKENNLVFMNEIGLDQD